MLTIRNLLVALDFGPYSQAALDYAFGVADKFDARVHLLHVFTLQDKAGAASWSKIELDQHVVESRQQLEATARHYAVTQRVGDVIWHDGDPAPHILAETSRRDIDLLVIGASGRRGVVRILLGSVAETVVREATCSVWVVRAS